MNLQRPLSPSHSAFIWPTASHRNHLFSAPLLIFRLLIRLLVTYFFSTQVAKLFLTQGETCWIPWVMNDGQAAFISGLVQRDAPAPPAHWRSIFLRWLFSIGRGTSCLWQHSTQGQRACFYIHHLKLGIFVRNPREQGCVFLKCNLLFGYLSESLSRKWIFNYFI